MFGHLACISVVFYCELSAIGAQQFSSFGNITAPSVTTPPTRRTTSSVSINTSQLDSNWSYLYGGITNETLRVYCESRIEEAGYIYDQTAGITTQTRYITENYVGCTDCGPTTSGVPPLDTTVSETYTFTKPYTPIASPPCCSSCSILAHTVQIRFWPTPGPTPAVTEVVQNGFTYVSPSVYVVFRSLAAYDLCGTVGDKHDNVTLSFGQHELSTFISNAGLPGASTYAYAQLNYGDLATNCTKRYKQMEGPSNIFTVQKSSTIYYSSFIGNPCLPYLQVPPQIANVDPAWSTCTGAVDGYYDPPYALSTATGNAQSLPMPKPASPAPTPSPLPENTAKVGTTVDPQPSGSPSKSPPTPSQAPPGQAPPSQAAGPTTSKDSVFKPIPVSYATITNSPGQTTSIVVGGLTFSGIASPIAPASVKTPSVIGATTISIPPSGSVSFISTKTLAIGSEATISGTPVSVAPSGLIIGGGTLLVGSSTILLPPPAPSTPPSTILTIAGQTLTAALTAVVLGSTTLTPGGTALTLSGTPISLAPGGLLVVGGTSTLVLPAAGTSPQTGAILSIGGYTVTAAATGFALGSATLRPGGSAATVAGTPVSLALGGTLVVGGTQTVLLPTGTGASASSSTSQGVGGIVFSAFGPGSLGASSTTMAISPFVGGAAKGFGRLGPGWSWRVVGAGILMKSIISFCFHHINLTL